MHVAVRNSCADFNSYRAARVKSLFNVESGANFNLDADLPLENKPWKLGLIVGPSGSGKTSIGRQLFDGGRIYEPGTTWPEDKPIIDAIAPGRSVDDVTAALSAVGLGTVPSWLRPYHVLSMGERFRADLARIVCEAPDAVVVDEFTSVVDRQIAKIGALAFSKAWRRTGGQAVLLACHYDIIEWLQPDWTYDTASGEYTWGCLQPRPRFDVEIFKTGWEWWPMFEPHHYLKIPIMPAACCYVGFVDGEPVAHVGMGGIAAGSKGKMEARAARLVVMPEWQGAGVGLRFLNAVCEMQLRGTEGARMVGRKLTTVFHTSHPGLCAGLRRDPRWRQTSARLYGANKKKSASTMSSKAVAATGYGGHFRAVQGFRYYGERAA